MAKEIKRITLGLIFSWLFGIIFGITGVSLLFSFSVKGGISLILASLLLLPPVNKFSKEKFNLEISRGLKITGVIILFIIYSTSAISDISSSNVNSNDNPSKPIDNLEQPAKQIYSLGEEVVVGGLAYTFHSYETKDIIGEYIFNNLMGEKADGIFLVFDVTIENKGDESKNLWASYVKIIDDQERKFEHDSTAEIYLKEDSFTFEQIQPGLPKRGKIVFDVPKNIKGSIEVSSDSLWSDEVKYISWDN